MKTAILNIAPGKTVEYHGEPCLVLEHRKDGTLMLHLDQMTHAFGSSNNFAASSLRSHLNDEVVIDAAPFADEDTMLSTVCSIMGEPVPWAPDLPLKAAGWVGYYFTKD